jgi:hypothetical protein
VYETEYFEQSERILLLGAKRERLLILTKSKNFLVSRSEGCFFDFVEYSHSRKREYSLSTLSELSFDFVDFVSSDFVDSLISLFRSFIGALAYRCALLLASLGSCAGSTQRFSRSQLLF